MTTIAYKVGKGKNQKYVLIETTGRGNVPRNASTPVVKKAALMLDEHLDSVMVLVKSVRDKLEELNRPGKIGVEFGIELGLDVSIPMITTGSAKGNFKVSLEWENPPKKEVKGGKT